MRDARAFVGFRREIAFMRDTDHVVHQTKHACDLRRRGQERDNPDHECWLSNLAR